LLAIFEYVGCSVRVDGQQVLGGDIGFGTAVLVFNQMGWAHCHRLLYIASTKFANVLAYK
jgi:hypothetical protein